MTCYKPHIAYEAIGVLNPNTGNKIIRYSSKGMRKKNYSFGLSYDVYRCEDDVFGYDYKQIMVPCQNCIGCRLDKAKHWALRNYHESITSSSACFITLTFGDGATIDNVFHLREFSKLSRNKKFEAARKRCHTLVRGDFSKFIKRLRARLSEGFYYIDEKTKERKFYQQTEGLRYYACGEYGELNERPHYHALIYNFDFPDKRYLATEHGNVYWTSDILSEAWGYGFVYVSDFTINTANYVSRYVTKKINGSLKDQWYQGKESEYQVCSNRPGIGRSWFEKYYKDVYPTDQVLYPTRKGKKVVLRPPKYYDKLFDKFFPDDFAEVKKVRELWIASREVKDELKIEFSSERLSVKEECARLRMKKLIRVYERANYTGVNLDDILSKCNEYGIPYRIITSSSQYTAPPPGG